MAILNAANAATRFSMIDPELVAFAAPVGVNTATSASWTTLDGSIITAEGSGFIYDGAGRPTGGLVTKLTFDLTANGEPDPLNPTDPVLTAAVAIDMAALTQPPATAPEFSAEVFWAAALGGDDHILAPGRRSSHIFGDFFQVAGGGPTGSSLSGGDDLIEADVTVGGGGLAVLARRIISPFLSGDAVNVSGFAVGPIAFFADLAGGNDIIRQRGLSAYDVTGDAAFVGGLGSVTGGNDTISSTVAGDPISGLLRGAAVTAGDAFEVEAGGSVRGGNDRITGTNYAFFTEYMAGDVTTSGGSVIGGADSITGNAGQELISGDVQTLTGGSLTGGADVLTGGEDSDILVGDLFIAEVGGVSADPLFVVANITGGNDRIYGNAGNDIIAGDAYAGDYGNGSVIRAGNDSISGGDGDDRIYGDMGLSTLTALLPAVTPFAPGNDRIDGGNGNDAMDGQAGIDTLIFASVAAGVIADLVIGTATGQGSDTIRRFENISGSTMADRLRGDAAVNILDGGAGDDALNGRGGNDTLIGRDGNDTLYGLDGADLMSGGAGSDIFAFTNIAAGPVVLDRITDFLNGADRLDLTAFGFAGFAAVQALASNVGGILRIDLPGQETVQVGGMTLALFNAADVIL